jgi:hypothetical protein
MKVYLTVLTVLLFASCVSPHRDESSSAQVSDSKRYPPPGSNQMLRAPITVADGLEVIISDVVVPPRAVHAPRGGSDGARAVVFRVHVEGAEERILIE